MACCSKCGKPDDLSEHHILPQRWFNGDGKVIVLCRRCHDEIERRIHNAEKTNGRMPLEREEYFLITIDFLSKPDNGNNWNHKSKPKYIKGTTRQRPPNQVNGR